MGKEKYQKKVLKLFEESPIVTFKSIEKIVGYKKNIKQYSKQLVRNLLKRGKIKKMGKGIYTRYDDPALFVLCLKDSYLGLHSALSFYNLWEQETAPVIITPEKIRLGIRIINGQNVLIKRIDKKYAFGIKYQKSGDFYLPYSDMEKTFIDFFYFNQKLDEGIINEFKRNVDRKKIKDYINSYPKKFQNKVLDNLR